jgi:hypothetical protein
MTSVHEQASEKTNHSETAAMLHNVHSAVA